MDACYRSYNRQAKTRTTAEACSRVAAAPEETIERSSLRVRRQTTTVIQTARHSTRSSIVEQAVQRLPHFSPTVGVLHPKLPLFVMPAVTQCRSFEEITASASTVRWASSRSMFSIRAPLPPGVRPLR